MAEKVEDQELDAAAEAVEDTPVEDAVEDHEEEKEEAGTEEEEREEETEEVKEEPEDNAARSKMGRKLSALEKQLEGLTTLLESKNDIEEQEPVDEDMPMTLRELKAFMAQEKEDTDSAKVKYDNEYVKKFIVLSEEMDEDTSNAIADEMESNYNSIYTKDGAADAEKNWYKAQIAVLKSDSKVKNPLKGGKTKVPLGVTGGDKVATKGYKMPKLDAAAQDLIANSNFTEKDIEDALSDGKNVSVSGDTNMKNV